MADLGKAYVQIVPSASGITGSISKVLNPEATAAGKSAGSKISSTIGTALKVGGALIGVKAIGSAVVNLVGQINDTNSAWKSFSDNMEMTGMSSKGIKSIKADLQDFAKKTIYSSKDMAATFGQLYAVNDKTTTAMVKGFGAVAAASQDPVQAMKTISTQATQMVAKPMVAWQDFKLMLEQSPAGMAQVAKQMGMSMQELDTAVQDGKVKTEDFLAAFEQIGNDPDGKLMKMATSYKTIGQAAEGLTATLATKLAPGFEVVNKLGIDAITGITSAAGTFLDMLTESFDGVGTKFTDMIGSIGDLFGDLFNRDIANSVLKTGLDIVGDSVGLLFDGINEIVTIADQVITFFEENKLAADLLAGAVTAVAVAYGILKKEEIVTTFATIGSTLIGGMEDVYLGALLFGDKLSTLFGILGGSVLTAVALPLGALVTMVLIAKDNWSEFCKKSSEDIQAWKDIVNNIIGGVKDFIGDFVAKSKADIKAWKQIFTNAKDHIKSIIDKIKSFFNITLKFQGIKLPHIDVFWKTGGAIAKIAQKMGLPGVPDFDVRWYAKGGIFDNPSVIGIGEAGPEAVVPLDKFWDKIDNLKNSTSNNLIDKLKNITITVVSTLDGKVIAKQQAPLINERLGHDQILAERGVI